MQGITSCLRFRLNYVHKEEVQKIDFCTYYIKKVVNQTMSSSLMPSYLDPDIFVNNISSTLYREHLENLYWTCRSMHAELDKSGKYIYNKICLHYTPHSIDDLPAVINCYGDKEWYKEGKLHRDCDLPAIIGLRGQAEWYKEGKLHRDCDLPAVTYACGSQYWYIEGQKHRDGDLPAVIYSNGDRFLYKKGIFVDLR
jgi:hypothetical protein